VEVEDAVEKICPKVVGIDLAVKYSGVTAVELYEFPLWKKESHKVLFESQVEAGDSTAGRISAAKSMTNMVKSAGADLVVIEDYTRQRMSFNSYTTGELSGMLRLSLFERGIRQLWCSPVWLKSFLTVGNQAVLFKYPKSKQEIAEMVQEIFGFKSRLVHAKERSDATDAFVLAMIGGIYLLHEAEDPKTEKMVKETLALNKVFYGHGTVDGLLAPKHVLAGRITLDDNSQVSISQAFMPPGR